MSKRPSLRELLAVWLAGSAAELSGWLLIDGAEVMTPALAVGGLLCLTPFLLVVYTFIWAWPLAAAGNRTVVSALAAFAALVQTGASWFWVGAHDITLNTIVMRLLSLVNPVVFVGALTSAMWVQRRRALLERRPD